MPVFDSSASGSSSSGATGPVSRYPTPIAYIPIRMYSDCATGEDDATTENTVAPAATP